MAVAIASMRKRPMIFGSRARLGLRTLSATWRSSPRWVARNTSPAAPLPKSASLSEVTIYAGELELNGEVLPKDEAQRAYEEEKDQGHDAGLASKNGFQSFEFRVFPVPAGDRTRIRSDETRRRRTSRSRS